jgi:hypothetical protein
MTEGLQVGSERRGEVGRQLGGDHSSFLRAFDPRRSSLIPIDTRVARTARSPRAASNLREGVDFLYTLIHSRTIYRGQPADFKQK